MKEYKLLREARKKIRREFQNEKVEYTHGNNSEVTLKKINESMMKIKEKESDGVMEKKPFIVECPTCLKETDVSEFLPQLGTFDETECCCVHCDNTFILWDNDFERDDE